MKRRKEMRVATRKEANGLRGGCIILIDVPPGSAISLDGITRLTPSSSSSAAAASSPPSSDASTPFRRGLWIVGDVPSTASGAHFHLLVVRSGTNKDPERSNGGSRSLPVGFVLASPETTTSYATELGYDWIFARRYDPGTEEISNESVDELTLKNLAMAVGEGGELGKFVIPYDQFVGTPSNDDDGGGNATNTTLPPWEARTSMINARHLRRRHGFSHGDKIVPSSDKHGQNDGSKANSASAAVVDASESDGASASYPPIPCIDRTVGARRLARHSGTRAYLSRLSPEMRTRLLLGGGRGAGSTNPGECVRGDVLRRHYGGNDDPGGGGAEGERDFFADVQLSFLLFLFLECRASLEHWRDAVSMCSLSAADDGTSSNFAVIQHPAFFRTLLSVLRCQLSCIETEFFREAEYSSGEDNFVVGALRRLCDACESEGKRKRDGDAMLESLKSTSLEVRRMVRDRFGLDLSPKQSNDDEDMEVDMFAIDAGDEDGRDNSDANEARDNSDANEARDNQEEDDDEEDGAVMVPYDQIEASLARSLLQSSQALKRHNRQTPLGSTAKSRSKEYPLLYAAMALEEDEVMACARILDEKKDVSLVREAAAYLEEVEAHRGGLYL